MASNESKPAASILTVGFWGGVGGVIIACFFLPVARTFGGDAIPGREWIIPLGFLHGFGLAVIPLTLWRAARQEKTWVKWVLTVVCGWFAGWFATFVLWVDKYLPFSKGPIHGFYSLHSLMMAPGGFFYRLFPYWFLQIVGGRFPIYFENYFARPFYCFGLVSLLFHLFITHTPVFKGRSSMAKIGACILCGALGSLWFWWDPTFWFFGPLQGSIWGLSVGIAMARTKLGCD